MSSEAELLRPLFTPFCKNVCQENSTSMTDISTRVFLQIPHDMDSDLYLFFDVLMSVRYYRLTVCLIVTIKLKSHSTCCTKASLLLKDLLKVKNSTSKHKWNMLMRRLHFQS